MLSYLPVRTAPIDRQRGELTEFVGPPGCGKSTLLRKIRDLRLRWILCFRLVKQSAMNSRFIRPPELIPAQRRALVLEHVRRKGAASIQELSEAVGASSSTVRRDLEHLERKGYLERSHGGALVQRTRHSTFEPEAVMAALFARAEKRAIGAHAASNLKPGNCVIFDSGSTVLAAAYATVARSISLTAVTNDLRIGQVLAQGSDIKVVVPGGSVRPGSLTLVGDPGETFLRGIHADVAFVGTHAITGEILTETSLDTAAMKRAMIAAAGRVVLLADATKFQPAAFCKICDVTALHEVVTDAAVGHEQVSQLRDLGIAVTVVPTPPAAGQPA